MERRNRTVASLALTLLSASLPVRGSVVLIQDPAVEITRSLENWNDESQDSGARWSSRSGITRASVANGFIRVGGEGRIDLRDNIHPNRFPYVRFRAGGSPQSGRTVRVNASPDSKENARSLAMELPSGGEEFSIRLPPDRVLTTESYDAESLRLEFENNIGEVALDYVMVDSVPTFALAEFDSPFPEAFKPVGLARNELSVTDGYLRLHYARGASVSFMQEIPDRPYDAIELRLRLHEAGGEGHKVTLHWTSESSDPGEFSIDLPPDGEFHTFRLHLHKETTWRTPVENIRLEFKPGPANRGALIDIDYLRLRDFPNPGGGNISSGLLALDENPDDWSDTARLVDRWRFVAGQSYKGNLARMWQSLGKPFRENRILWETDHPTWQWLIVKNEWPRTADGSPDLKAAARLAYADLNAAAEFLEKRNARLDAVHFDGLFKRLLLPKGNPHDGKSADGGLLEFTKGDYSKAYRLAAETFCEFLVLARNEADSALKETRFYIQPNFHVWAWRYGAQDYDRIFTNLPAPGNFKEMMDALNEADHAFLARGAYAPPSPFAGYGADWVFMDRQARRLVSFEWYSTEVQDREFNVVNNGTLKGDSPAERAEESLDYLLQFRSEGGRPTSYTPYFWQTTWRDAEAYGADGDAVLPETEACTVTWTLLHSARLCLFMQADALPEVE